VLDYILVSLFYRREPLYPSVTVGLSHINVALGIGENWVQIRARVTKKLGWLGVIFDSSANSLLRTLISRPESPIGLYVVHN
jgi:acetate kinase